MARVITFSRKFPAYHPKAGQSTYFIEKFLNSIQKDNYWFGKCVNCGWMGSSAAMAGGGQIADTGDYDDPRCPKCYHIHMDYIDDMPDDYYIGKFEPKHHTIRAGNRWKAGDKFSPRVWSGTPYNSKQIIIAPDTEIVKVWCFEVVNSESIRLNSSLIHPDKLCDIAENDGLNHLDLLDWFRFPKPFKGQIICWDESVNY